MSDTAKRLKEMAQLSLLANRISEIQEKNLKSFPFIFFNGVKSVKIDYDLSKPLTVKDSTGQHVTYLLELEEKENDHLEKRFEAIENSTRMLFWSDLKVRVFFKDKLVYESKKNEQPSS